MYFLGSEHNPPHVHAIYSEDTAAFDIRSGEVIEAAYPLVLMIWCGSGWIYTEPSSLRCGRRKNLRKMIRSSKGGRL